MKQHLIERMLYIILGLVFLAASVAAFVSIRAYEEFTRQQEVLQQQVAGQQEVLKGMKELVSNQGQTTDEINKSLSCILVFFGKVDRASYYISNLRDCTITNIDTGTSEVLPLPALRPQQPSTQSVPPASQPQQTPQPVQPVQPTTPPAPESPSPQGLRSIPLIDSTLRILGL